MVGAIYLDGGLKSVEKFIFIFWEEYLIKSTITLIDSKTKLQEFSLKKFKELPKYIFLKKLDHNIDHYLKLKYKYPIQKNYWYRYFKKNAQQNAAAKLLKILNI